MEAGGTITAKRVFGKPVAKNGVVVIPVAKIGGGGRCGSPRAGLGLGPGGRPVGVYVIRGEKVRWRPAIDVNGLLLRAQMIAAATAIIVVARRRR